MSHFHSDDARGTVERAYWATFLAECDRGELDELFRELSRRYRIDTVDPAVSGLGMLQLADSVMRDGFHLGEFSLSSASVDVIAADGESVRGGAAILRDDAELAHSLAVFDAVLANRWDGYQRIERLLAEGRRAVEARDQERKRILAATTVDFSTLDDDS